MVFQLVLAVVEPEESWGKGHPRLWVSQVSAGTLLAVGQFPAETRPSLRESILAC